MTNPVNWEQLPLFGVAAVRQGLNLLLNPGQVFELRILEALRAGDRRTTRVIYGYFDEVEKAVEALVALGLDMAKGIYVTLNPVAPALLARSFNRFSEAQSGSTTSDGNIVVRRWILVDLDPVRPVGVSATEEEKENARNLALQIIAYLKGKGWPEPILVDSGNGFHLIFLIDLPASGTLVKDCLEALAKMFDTPGVKVDTTVANAARIIKIPGTRASKGDDCPALGRPYRLAQIISKPEVVAIVPQAKLEELAAEVQTVPSRRAVGTSERVSVSSWALDHMQTFVGQHLAECKPGVFQSYNGGHKCVLEVCPFDSAHNDRSAVITLSKEGRPGFKCQHASCSAYHWRDLQAMYDPSACPPPCDETADADTRDQDSLALRSALLEILRRPNTSQEERFKHVARAVVAALLRRGQFYFHLLYRDHATAMYFDSTRQLLLGINSDSFLSWLADFCGINRAERAFQFIIKGIEDESLTGQTTGLIPEVYWAARPGAIYLSSGDGKVVKISAGKIETLNNGTDGVLFAAGQTLRPWVLGEPRDPFLACRLFSDMRASAAHGLELIRLFTVSLPSNPRCKPPFAIVGPIGSGKTRAAVGIAELWGLPIRVLDLSRENLDEVWVSLDMGGLVILDNVDTHISGLADLVARASTGGSHEKRRLYTDGQIIQLNAKAWIIITTANPTFAADAGIADRLLVERLERRESGNSEGELSTEIAANRDAGLSWIAETLSKALADTGCVPCDLNNRHPDFAALAVRIGRAIGRESQAIAALQAAEQDKSLFNLENDELGAALLVHMQGRMLPLTGPAGELLTTLATADAVFSDPRKWTGKKVSRRIEKLWPHLVAVLGATRERDTHTKAFHYTFNRPVCGVCGVQEVNS